MTHDRDRGKVQLVDVMMTAFLLIGMLTLAPYYYTFTAMVSDAADPFSALLLRLIVPSLFIGLILSVGVSARRGP